MLAEDIALWPRLRGFSLAEPAFLKDPYDMVTRAHQEAPVFFDDAINAWVITKYQDIAAILSDYQTYSSRAVGRIPVPADIAPRAADFAKDEIIFAIDPPEHTLARQTLQYGFAKKVIDPLAEHAATVANEVIDRIIDRGTCNLIDDVCYAFSLGVIMKMLDLPTEHAADYRRWAGALFALLTPKALDADEAPPTLLGEPEIRARWNDLAEANLFLRDVIAEREKAPGADLISAMLAARDDKGNRYRSGRGRPPRALAHRGGLRHHGDAACPSRPAVLAESGAANGAEGRSVARRKCGRGRAPAPGIDDDLVSHR